MSDSAVRTDSLTKARYGRSQTLYGLPHWSLVVARRIARVVARWPGGVSWWSVRVRFQTCRPV